MTSSDIIAAARIILKEPAITIWDDTVLGNYLTDAIREISNKEPLKKYVNLPVIQYTTRVDISSQTDILRIIPQNEVEFPVGNPGYYPIYRDTELAGTELNILLNSVPTITSGTLTGTVTFTKDSRTVTGSGTLFSSELSAGLTGSFIAHHSGTKYYQIAYITSDTSLTLAEPFAETTATDTVSLTKYRAYDSVARICYGAKYTVSTTSDMPQKMDETAILGVAAKAAVALLGDYIKNDGTEVELDAADTNLTNAATKVSSANPGGDEAGKLTAIASARAAIAQQRISGNKNLSGWANDLAAAYQTSLNKLGRPTDGAKHLCSRDL
jgi:hypothetical protein